VQIKFDVFRFIKRVWLSVSKQYDDRTLKFTVKVVSEHNSMKAYWGSRDVILLIL